jgi:Zn-ribbon containing protein
MPHRCTDCGRSFDDGSKEMLSGCPQCGGATFQFYPDGADPTEMPPPEETAPPDPPGSSVTRTVGSAATTVRELFGVDTARERGAAGAATDAGRDTAAGRSPDGPQDTDSRSTETPGENSAQASARGDPIETLPPAPDEESIDEPHQFDPPTDDKTNQPAEGHHDRPDLSELREELNDQFESIKVLQPGQYELNLMELYDREEYIVALQEDGKYTIQIPERWE